jgi:hypothetical protein
VIALALKIDGVHTDALMNLLWNESCIYKLDAEFSKVA